ncbi:MAG: hypothetical protein ACK42G_05700 [Candidatus Kapaibacteriota bacterium]
MKKFIATIVFSFALSILNVETKSLVKPIIPIILRTEMPKRHSLLFDFIKPLKNYFSKLYLN